MKKETVRFELQNIAKHAVPTGTSILGRLQKSPGIADKGKQGTFLRLSTNALLLAAAILILLASAAYAAYRILLDPGLQAVKDAGLGIKTNLEAETIVLPENSISLSENALPIVVNETQTWEDLTMTLDWVSLNQSRLIFGFHIENLPQGNSIGLPEITFNGTNTNQGRGSTLVLNGDEPVNGEFISYQVINDVEKDATVDLSIRIPILDGTALVDEPLYIFQYELESVPWNSGTPAGGQQTYAAKVNGQEIRLKWLRAEPNLTSAWMCYEIPTESGSWLPQAAALQFASTDGTMRGEPVTNENISVLSDENRERCVEITAPVGHQGTSTIVVLSLGQLSNGEDNRIGAWQFFVTLPEPWAIPVNTVAPTSETLNTQSIGDLTAVLKWAYADVSRVALLISFEGWKEGYGVGEVMVTDDTGTQINSGYGLGSPGDNPSEFLIDLYFGAPGSITVEQIKFNMDLPVYYQENQVQPFAVFRFSLDLPVYPAGVYSVDQTTQANGIEMQLRQLAITPSTTEAVLCYQKPDSNDWMIGHDALLKIGDNEALLGGYILLSDVDYGGVVGKNVTDPSAVPQMVDGRCVKVSFPVGDLGQTSSRKITISIPGLEKSTPEIYPDEQLLPALETLRGEGIDISIYSSSGSGGGGGGWTVNAKPEGMTDEEAYQRFLEVISSVRAGPWVFELEIP